MIDKQPIHILSLGAGVQSSCLALMAAQGEVTPMPVAAIFADTKAEPASVYRWLDWLEKQLPFPVYRVSRGSLTEKCLSVYVSPNSGKVTAQSIPAFLRNPDGSAGMMPRQCTRDFKVDVVTKEVNRLRREAGTPPAKAFLWIGISTNEAHRAKEHRNHPRIENIFPLLDRRMNRQGCLSWMTQNGFPKPPRSACVYCPFHNDAEWRRLRAEEPEEFARAVQFERDFQKITTQVNTINGVPFLHRSLVPLDRVDFSTEEERGQLDMFGNECEGMCGV